MSAKRADPPSPPSVNRLGPKCLLSMRAIAKSDPGMWSQIFTQNKTHLLEVMYAYEAHLKEFRKHIESSDEKSIIELIEKANKIRKALK